MIDRRRLLMTATAVVASPRILRGAESDTVRFGMLYPNLTTVIHEIAKRTGCYERHNLKVVETRFKSGQTVEGVEQLWRSNLDFYMGAADGIALPVPRYRFDDGDDPDQRDRLRDRTVDRRHAGEKDLEKWEVKVL
jgi:hypothetical protein